MAMNKAFRMMMLGGYDNKLEKHHDKPKEDDNEEIGELDKPTAEEWVANMTKTDGSVGGKWTYEQTTQLMKQKGLDCDTVDFYAAMNSIYSDYGKTLVKYGVSSADVYAELAYDWVKDPDAQKNKAALYYKYIVE